MSETDITPTESGVTSDTGVWIDVASDPHQVVTEPPERGIQLVAPGQEVTPDVARAIDRAKEYAAGASSVETATVDKAAGGGRSRRSNGGA